LAELIERLAQILLRRFEGQLRPQERHQGFTTMPGGWAGDGLNHQIDQERLDFVGTEFTE
jgi:hypothetical protein